MQRMTGIDPMFIYSDTPGDPDGDRLRLRLRSRDPRRRLQLRTGESVLETRIPTLQPFRRRLMPVPLGLDHPRPGPTIPSSTWPIDLHRVALPAPGGGRRVPGHGRRGDGPPAHAGAASVADLHAIEGVADGMVVLIAKVHHAVIDGVAAALEMLASCSTRPRGECGDRAVCTLGPAAPAVADPADDRRAARRFIRSPIRGVRAAREVGRTAVRLARCAVDDRLGPVSIPLGRARHVRVARARPPGGLPSPSWTWRRCGR